MGYSMHKNVHIKKKQLTLLSLKQHLAIIKTKLIFFFKYIVLGRQLNFINNEEMIKQEKNKNSGKA